MLTNKVLCLLLLLISTISTSASFQVRVIKSVPKQCLVNETWHLEPGEKLLNPKKIRQNYMKVDFSLRGPIYYRTNEISEELANGAKKPFKDVLRANLVDCQSTGQKPNTFLRQLVAAVTFPLLLNSSVFPSDVVQRANEFLSHASGHTTGSLTNAKGSELVRKHVAEFLFKRDAVPANPENIFLTNGISGGIELAMKLVQMECSDNVGIMVPVPLYPLYSAFITEHGLKQINYYLNPEKEWSLDVNELERAYQDALCSCNCRPRAIIVINPGNPTCKILRRSNLEEIIKFAHRNNLIIFADEVYQFNILGEVPFISMRKVLHELGAPYKEMELISFFSISKGFTAEGALRGGYMELINMDKGVLDILMKLASVKLCPNIIGQVGLFSLMNPPNTGEPSYESNEKEKSEYIQEHKEIAKRLMQGLNNIKGFKCPILEGGAIAFPKITIPDKAVKVAETGGNYPDIFYGLELLETFGVSVAVGSAFGLSPSQTYLRISIPSRMEDCERLLQSLQTFNEQFIAKYS